MTTFNNVNIRMRRFGVENGDEISQLTSQMSKLSLVDLQSGLAKLNCHILCFFISPDNQHLIINYLHKNLPNPMFVKVDIFDNCGSKLEEILDIYEDIQIGIQCKKKRITKKTNLI